MAKRELIILPSTNRRLEEAVEYYSRQASERIATRLRKSVARALIRLMDFPFLYGKMKSNYRAIRVNRFPYVLIYTVHHSRIVV